MAKKKKERILIVDDEPINLEFFDVMLSKLGFDVEKAESGEEALENIKEKKPDLIVLDNIMPGLTGWEVTKKLKSDLEYDDFKNVPIIMFSAMDSVEDKIEGFELGVDDYITKPFNFSEVLARIRAVLRNKALARQVSRKERRIAVVESLNKSLIFFTQHIRKPISRLLELAENADSNEGKDVKKILDLLKKEGKNILATLSGLEEEIAELESQDDQLKEDDLALEDLEQKFRKHLLNSGAKKK
jgi:DNA-binding response OmpR family regulator